MEAVEAVAVAAAAVALALAAAAALQAGFHFWTVGPS